MYLLSITGCHCESIFIAVRVLLPLHTHIFAHGCLPFLWRIQGNSQWKQNMFVWLLKSKLNECFLFCSRFKIKLQHTYTIVLSEIPFSVILRCWQVSKANISKSQLIKPETVCMTYTSRGIWPISANICIFVQHGKLHIFSIGLQG